MKLGFNNSTRESDTDFPKVIDQHKLSKCIKAYQCYEELFSKDERMMEKLSNERYTCKSESSRDDGILEKLLREYLESKKQQENEESEFVKKKGIETGKPKVKAATNVMFSGGNANRLGSL